MKKQRKALIVWLLVVCLVTANVMPVMAGEFIWSQTYDETVTRISNPDNKPGQADGLKAVGDRTAGYGWSIAERGDYIYIGTWKNTGGAIITNMILPALNQYGDYTDLFWAVADVLTNGDIAKPVDGSGGEIIKMNKNNPGEFETVFVCNNAFRNAYVYGDDIYFVTYAPLTKNPSIYKLDIEDNMTLVYETTQGSSMRAGTVYNDRLYFGGTYVPRGTEYDPSHAEMAIICKHVEDDGWDLVADDTDFGAYCDDPLVTNLVSSPIWSMTAFHDELYVSIPGTRGFIIFAGHPAKDGETANQYGWNWREIVGRTNGKNYPGVANHVKNQEYAYNQGGYYGSGEAGFLSVVCTFQVFHDELYIYDMDNTLPAELTAVGGMMKMLLADENVDASAAWKPLYSSLRHPQRLWKLGEDGNFIEAEGFTKKMEGTSNEYVWRSAEYNGNLYIGTMDAKVYTNYLTRITGASIFDMSAEEWQKEIGYIRNLAEYINQSGLLGEEELPMDKVNAVLDQFSAFITWYDGLDNTFDEMKITEFLSSLVPTREEAFEILEKVKQEIENSSAVADELKEKIDKIKDNETIIRTMPELLSASMETFSTEDSIEGLAITIDLLKLSFIMKVDQLENEKIDKDAIANAVVSIDSDQIARLLQPVFASIVADEDWEENKAEFIKNWGEFCDNGMKTVDFLESLASLYGSKETKLPWDDIADLLDLFYDNTIAKDLGTRISSYGNMTIGMAKRFIRAEINQILDQISVSDFTDMVSQFHAAIASVLGMENANFESLLTAIDSMDENTLAMMMQFLLPTLANSAFDKMKEGVEDEQIISFIEQLRTNTQKVVTQMTQEEYLELAKIVKNMITVINPKIDTEAIQMYLDISRIIRNDDQGFDIIRTSDGENFETVTTNGFGDKWNYGALRFLPTDQGMYITTANPFYGTQLYLLTRETYDDNDDEEDNTDEDTDDEKDDDQDNEETEYYDYDYEGFPLVYESSTFDLIHEGYGELSFDKYPDLIKGTAYSRLIDHTTNYVSDHTTDDMPMVYYYSDHFFDFPATEFNPHLNTLSAVLSSVSIASHRAEGSDAERAAGEIDIFQNKSRNVQEMLYQMGFDDIYVNESYTKMPELNSVGVVIAHKTIINAEGKPSTLVVLTPRNAGYLYEWYNNFDFGAEGNHKGFQYVADVAYAELIDYIEKNGISGDIKLWLAGTSRGATITNILSGMLDDSAEVKAMGIEKEDIYSYNIGATKGVFAFDENGKSKKLHSEKYGNIYNVVFDFDMVASILPNVDNGKGWNFERYGNDLTVLMGDSTKDYCYEHQMFMESLDDFLAQMLVINPYTTYFGKDQVAEEYLPVAYRKTALQVGLSSVPEILDAALNEGNIDQATYLELASEYAVIAEKVNALMDEMFEKIEENLGLDMMALTAQESNSENASELKRSIKGVTEQEGNSKDTAKDDSSGTSEMAEMTELTKDAASYLTKLVSKVGTETFVKNLVKVNYGPVEDSTETFADVLKRFNRTLAYSVTRQKYGEEYNSSIAMFVNLLEYVDSKQLKEFVSKIAGETGALIADIQSTYNQLVGSDEKLDSEILEQLNLLEEKLEDENVDLLEKARLASELLKKILMLETNFGEIYKEATGELSTVDAAIKEIITKDDGKELVRFLLRISTTSMRYPAAFDFSPFESISAISGMASGVNFMFAAHDAGVFVSFARLYDSFYQLEGACENNAYHDLNRVTDYEKLGYRTVKLPENTGLRLTVKQVSTSDGSNSKVSDGTVLSWTYDEGVSGRKDPSVFVNVYPKGTQNAVVSYDAGSYLFLPLDHEYEISITTTKENNFDLPVYEHSLIGSYAVKTLSRVIDSDEKSEISHQGIKLYDCDTLIMKAEGFGADVVARALYGTEDAKGSLLVPLSNEEGAAYYPIDIFCDQAMEQGAKDHHHTGKTSEDSSAESGKTDDGKTDGKTDGKIDDGKTDSGNKDGKTDVQSKDTAKSNTSGNDVSKGTTRTGSTPKTGDSSDFLSVLLVLMVSAEIVFFLRKREDNIRQQ